MLCARFKVRRNNNKKKKKNKKNIYTQIYIYIYLLQITRCYGIGIKSENRINIRVVGQNKANGNEQQQEIETLDGALEQAHTGRVCRAFERERMGVEDTFSGDPAAFVAVPDCCDVQFDGGIELAHDPEVAVEACDGV